MKKLAFVSLALFVLVGCAALKQVATDAKSCVSDPVCLAEAKAQADQAKGVAVAIGGISPIPLSSNLVGGVAYGAVLIYALIQGGRKKRQEETTEPPTV